MSGSDINSLCIVGRLTRDAELKYTNTGMALSSFSIAVNKKWKKDGQTEERVSFFDCVLWGKRAEVLDQYLTKGKQIGINGELSQNRWENNEGQIRSKVEIVVNYIQLLGGRSQNQSQYNQEDVKPMTADDREDIPF